MEHINTVEALLTKFFLPISSSLSLPRGTKRGGESVECVAAKLPNTREVLTEEDFVAALQQKRTLAFVNHFAITTVQFLNNFMKKCEQKLMNFERKLEKVEAAMVLLEARLSSIPEVNTSEPETTATLELATPTNPGQEQPEHTQPETITSNEQASVAETESPVESHPEYDRFVKMVQVGVPIQAVKLKVSVEGLDPQVLEKILGK